MTVRALTPPGEEPPAAVSSEILWRVAVRLYREHGAAQTSPTDPLTDSPSTDPPPTCVRCGQPWPCSGRRLAELGMNAARA
ncbi:MAG TPA: hypothetical protein VK028_05535 [Micromonosporaceae bacterium]|nr:hypothetical protein [Micromonosporaceae bacterium]